MSLLDRYLLRESLPPLLFGWLLYSVLAVTSMTLPRLQWIVGVPLPSLLHWFLLQLPAATVQTLPLALLLAVLLAYGRLAAASELLAAQAGGVTLRRLTVPFLVLGLVASGLSLFLSEWVLPRTNARVGALYWELTSGGSGLFRLANQTLPLGSFTLHFSGVDRATDELFEVRLESWTNKRLTVIFADRARFVGEGLELYGFESYALDLAALLEGGDAETTLRNLLRAENRARAPEQSLTITTLESVDALITRYSGGGFEDARSLRALRGEAGDPNLTLEARRLSRVLFHRKVAEAVANFTLLLVAVPLAILYARSRSVAFGLSLVITLLWYLLLSVGVLLAQTGMLPVGVGVWAGNGVLALLGMGLLWTRVDLR